MSHHVRIALVGDYTAAVPAHQAIPLALQAAADTCGIELGCEWVPSEEIVDVTRISRFDGLWCVPASPYRSMAGVLLAIRHAREAGVPFLGTCGGFQHAVIEYARNVLGWDDAEHAETAPDAARAVIAPLACALIAVSETIRLLPGNRIAAAYGRSDINEAYHCRFGLSPQFQSALLAGPLRAAAADASGEVRAVELASHPFFVATLFQPERAALQGLRAPLVDAFVRACAA